MNVIKERLPNIGKIIECLMNGTKKPDKIILVMSEKPFLLDEGIHPWDVRRGSCKIMEFRFVENIGPLRRLQTIVKEYWDEPETQIITFDDDRKPAQDMVEKLVKYSNKHPNIAVGRAGNIFNVNRDKGRWGGREIVLGWGISQPRQVDILNQGVGALFKPKFFTKDFFDLDKWKEYGVKYTDEFFVSYILANNNIKRMVIPCQYGGEFTTSKNLWKNELNIKYKKKQLNDFWKTLCFDKSRTSDKFLDKEGVSYSYFVKDIIKIRGEKWVRDSFESMKSQSDDVMVVDYDSIDNIKDLVGEYNFKYFKIERSLDQYYHDSKMTNKSIIEAKYDIYMGISPDIIYHKDMTKFILDFYSKHDKNKEVLILQCKKNPYNEYRSPMMVHNKNLLLKARGIDERITFYGDGHWYINNISLKVFKLKPYYIYEPLKLQHRDHSREYEGIRISDEKQQKSRAFTKERTKLLSKNFNKEVKNVVNSYW